MEGAQTVKKDSQVAEQLNRLASIIERLLGMNARIEERISTILVCQPPSKEEDKTLSPNLVGLASVIFSFALKLEKVYEHQEEVLKRIEL